MILSSSGLRNGKGRRRSTIIIAATAAVITSLFLPLTVISTNSTNDALLHSQSVFAQQQEEEGGGLLDGLFGGGAQQQGSEQQQETGFLPYINPIHGIFMQYPSNWTASTSGLTDYTDLIAFYSPLQNVSDSFPARLTISVITYSQNISLPEYTDFVWTILNQSEQVVDVKSSSSEVTLAGYPGYRVVLASQPLQNSTLVISQINTWTVIGNKVYTLNYEGEESRFNRHLPEVSQMLETLRIGISNMTTITTGENLIQQRGGGNQTGDDDGPLAPFLAPFQDLFGGGGQ